MTPTPTIERILKAKIIGFTKFPDGQDLECKAITEKGEEILVDPFVGCSWKYENREQLLNQWFEDKDAFLSKDGVWLTSEHSFKLLTPKSLQEVRNETIEECLKALPEEIIIHGYMPSQNTPANNAWNDYRNEAIKSLASLKK